MDEQAQTSASEAGAGQTSDEQGEAVRLWEKVVTSMKRSRAETQEVLAKCPAVLLDGTVVSDGTMERRLIGQYDAILAIASSEQCEAVQGITE